MGCLAPPMSAEGAIPLGGGAVASGSIRRGSGRALLDCGKLLKQEPLRGRFGMGFPGMTGFGWVRSTGSCPFGNSRSER
jgi:hypothetical protein